jgi:hypothetical protein
MEVIDFFTPSLFYSWGKKLPKTIAEKVGWTSDFVWRKEIFFLFQKPNSIYPPHILLLYKLSYVPADQNLIIYCCENRDIFSLLHLT